MLDLEQLQSIAQMLENMEINTRKLERSFASKNSEAFETTKKEILDSKNKIAEIVK